MNGKGAWILPPFPPVCEIPSPTKIDLAT